MMPSARPKLLIVDDDVPLRTLLSQIFTAFGHNVRSADDGFSALVEIRKEIPDILLSDLNMPGMSGFELLSVVRRRFPVIQVIAMSGAFSGNAVPLGVAADAFHQKGTNPGNLLQIVKAMTPTERSSLQHPSASAPIWIPKNGHDPSGVEYVMITCPDCLRTFPQVLGEGLCIINETGCLHCSCLVHYAIVPPAFAPMPIPRAPTTPAMLVSMGDGSGKPVVRLRLKPRQRRGKFTSDVQGGIEPLTAAPTHNNETGPTPLGEPG